MMSWWVIEETPPLGSSGPRLSILAEPMVGCKGAVPRYVAVLLKYSGDAAMIAITCSSVAPCASKPV